MSMPPIAPTPSERLPLAPTPVAIAKGNNPNIIVSDVIRIGRKRTAAASNAAASMLIPWRRRAEAYSVSRMAVFDSRPISIISPVCM